MDRNLTHTLFGMALLASSFASAQTFPVKPVRVISTLVAGSGADSMLRTLLQKMSENIGQPVVIDVRMGGGGVVGAEAVIRSPADGYTLLHAEPTTVLVVPFLLKNQPYDPLKDFTPISVAMDGQTCIVVNEAVPARSVTELFAYIRKNPGKLAYGHNGVGGTYHLNMEMLKDQLGLDVTPVPYKGGLAALQDAVAGNVPIAFSGLASAVRFAKAGKVRILAIMDNKRNPDLPDVPAMTQEIPVFEKLPTGLNIYGPVGIPRPVLVRLNAEIARAGKAPEVASKLKEFYIDPIGNSLEEFAAEHRRDYGIVQRAIKAAKIPLQ